MMLVLEKAVTKATFASNTILTEQNNFYIFKDKSYSHVL